MILRTSAGTIVACIALAGGLFLLNGQPRHGTSVPSANAAAADLAAAAAGVTFAIVAAEVTAPGIASLPLTGDSN